MPVYDFKCVDKNCGAVTEGIFTIAKRPGYIYCLECSTPGQRKLARRIISLRTSKNAESRSIWSKAFGINPDQIPDFKRRFPNETFHPVTGAMQINGYEHQKKVAKSLGMIID